jgi:hypothetical protein
MSPRALPELVGASEIAERLGLAQSESVHVWLRRYGDFPEPVARLSMGFVWRWDEVTAWAKTTGRLPAITKEEG